MCKFILLAIIIQELIQYRRFFERDGCVSGGLYGDKTTCMPYELPPCSHHEPGKYPDCGSIKPTPRCQKTCVNGKTFDSDRHYGVDAYSVRSNVEEIQTEIMTNGPVEAAFSVYKDFITYKSGVYQHETGSFLGGHAVKILGWGEESGLPYWLVANSWNQYWGDQGYFKILRGKNECGIEGSIVAGKPKKF
jgi:cathepsin B